LFTPIRIPFRAILFAFWLQKRILPLPSFVRKGLEAEHYAVDVSADGETSPGHGGRTGF
jgi:hypothetical protein